jgi:hypothetical protein
VIVRGNICLTFTSSFLTDDVNVTVNLSISS